MTSDGYRALIRAMGLEPVRQSNGYSTLHKDRDNQFRQIPDPEGMTPEERSAYIQIIKERMGIWDH